MLLFADSKPNDNIVDSLAALLGLSPVLVLLAYELGRWLVGAGPGPVLRASNWLAICLRLWFPKVWHRLLRSNVELRIGTVDVLSLPAWKPSLAEIFEPLKVRLLGGSEANNSQNCQLEKILARHNRLILIGDAGSGKTTLAKALVAMNYSRGRFDICRTVAVFIPLRDLAVKQQSVLDAAAAILAGYRSLSAQPPYPNTRRLVEKAAERGQLLLILDGYDEVSDDAAERILKAIEEFLHEFAHNGNIVLLTCRRQAYAQAKGRLDRFSSLTAIVEPLTDEEIIEYLNRWPPYEGNSVRGLIELLQDPGAVTTRDMCRTPLLLTMLGARYLATGANPVGFSLPRTRKTFYDEVVRELLVEGPKRRGQEYAADNQGVKMKALGIAARSRYSANVKTPPDRIPEDQLKKAIRDAVISTTSPDSVIAELCNENAILTPRYPPRQGRDDQQYQFAHLTFLEYFAALRLVTQYKDAGEVLKMYGRREDRLDLLLWYVSLADAQVVEEVARFFVIHADNPIVAAECLIVGEAVTDEELVESVVESLLKRRTEKVTDIIRSPEWRLIAAMARRCRCDTAYVSAGRAYQELLKELTPEGGFDAFRVAFRVNPEATLESLQQFLDGDDSKWVVVVTHMLAEMASTFGETDERCRKALGMLVRLLLRSVDSAARREAAARLSDLLTVRGQAIAEFGKMLPPPPNDAEYVWPLSDLYPRSVVWALVESLAFNPNGVKNEAILAAIKAHEAYRNRQPIPRSWRYVLSAARTEHIIRIGLLILSSIWLTISALIGGAVVLVSGYGLLLQKPVFLTSDGKVTSPSDETLDWMKRVRVSAREVEDAIAPEIPHHLRQLLDWIRDKPDDPKKHNLIVYYNRLYGLKQISVCVNYHELPVQADIYFVIQGHASVEKVSTLRNTLDTAPEEVRSGRWRRAVAVPPMWLIDHFPSGCVCFLLPILWCCALGVVVIENTKFDVRSRYNRPPKVTDMGSLVMFAVALSLWGNFCLLVGGWGSDLRPELIGMLLATGAASFVVWVGLHGYFHWNRYIPIVANVRSWRPPTAGTRRPSCTRSGSVTAS